jgi:hypothetical protein
VIIVDDHLAVLAIAGRLPDIGLDLPVATTWSFHFRLARAVADSTRSGALSRRAADPESALRRILHPPAHRLVILDPRASVEFAVRASVQYRANLLLAELVGAAAFHQAAIRVSPDNVGQTWVQLMATEGIDFAAIEM